jgi:hypothetical protein
MYECKKDTDCKCGEGGRCLFDQFYGEGSRYKGFLVKDQVHFGEKYHEGQDAFDFTFGCV